MDTAFNPRLRLLATRASLHLGSGRRREPSLPRPPTPPGIRIRTKAVPETSSKAISLNELLHSLTIVVDGIFYSGGEWIALTTDPSKFRSLSPMLASRGFTCLFCNCLSMFIGSIFSFKFTPSVVVTNLLWALLTAPTLLHLMMLVGTKMSEPSPGKHVNFPAYPCWIYVNAFRMSFGLRVQAHTYPAFPA